jgi:hypothetical protein
VNAGGSNHVAAVTEHVQSRAQLADGVAGVLNWRLQVEVTPITAGLNRYGGYPTVLGFEVCERLVAPVSRVNVEYGNARRVSGRDADI